MVAIDSSMNFDGIVVRQQGERPLNGRLIAGAALLTALVGLATWAVFSFGDSGMRVGIGYAGRFASFVFLAAMLSGSLGRLFKGPLFDWLRDEQRDMMLAFAASYGVYIAAIIGGGIFTGTSTPAGELFFCLFSTVVLLVVFTASLRSSRPIFGTAGRRVMLGVANVYFWLSYALMAIAHLAGPHRPDGYYGLFLSLALAALLVRFADAFVQKLRYRADLAEKEA